MASKAKQAPKRLGDDLPSSAAGEPLNLIVAKSHIVAGKVLIKLEGPKTVRARRGQKVQVKHVYRAEEDSTEKEEYRFLLRSSLEGKDHPPALARIGDVYAVAEDIGGYLTNEFTLTGSGTQTLEFEVGAEYVVGGWKDSAVTKFDQKQAKGAIQIIVS